MRLHDEYYGKRKVNEEEIQEYRSKFIKFMLNTLEIETQRKLWFLNTIKSYLEDIDCLGFKYEYTHDGKTYIVGVKKDMGFKVFLKNEGTLSDLERLVNNVPPFIECDLSLVPSDIIDQVFFSCMKDLITNPIVPDRSRETIVYE